MDFDERIKVVIPMLEAKGLFWCASLIKDLKQSVDKCQNDSYNKAIDDVIKAIDDICDTERDRCNDFGCCSDCYKLGIKEMAEQLKR